MNSPLIAGLFVGWTAVQLAVGAFFLQAYLARRREVEYLLFALLCLAMAVADAGLTGVSAIHGMSHWLLATTLVHTGALFATALNVHFVFQLVLPKHVPHVSPAAYVVAAAYAAVIAFGGWWVPGTTHVIHITVSGIRIDTVLAKPTLVGISAYVTMLGANLIGAVTLVGAYRGGRRELRGAILGLVLSIGCALSDVLSVAFQLGTPPLFPYGFLIYGFGIADTLLVRYRDAAEELEVTASELRSATEELTNSYLELSVVQEELFHKRQLASVGELAAAIAHEVRNPLAVIVNAAASLKRPSLGPEDRNTLFGIIEEEIRRLNNIVTELVRYARPMNVRREDVVLGEVVKVLGESFDDRYSLTLKSVPGADIETVWADPSLLRLAMQNLVDNACQAMPGGGSIIVTATRDRVGETAGVRIEVTDTGQGMDSRTLRRAMDPFFSTRPSGTGLGLPITGRIVEAHGGRVDVQSRAGEGTTVALFVPDRRTEQRLPDPSRISSPG